MKTTTKNKGTITTKCLIKDELHPDGESFDIEYILKNWWNKDKSKKEKMVCPDHCGRRVVPVNGWTKDGWTKIANHFRHYGVGKCMGISKFHEDCVAAVERNKKILFESQYIAIRPTDKNITVPESWTRKRPDLLAFYHDSTRRLYVEIDFRHKTKYQKNSDDTYRIDVEELFRQIIAEQKNPDWDWNENWWLALKILEIPAELLPAELQIECTI